MSTARFTAAVAIIPVTPVVDLEPLPIVQETSITLDPDALVTAPGRRRGAPRKEYVWLYGLDGEQVGVVT